MKMKFYINFKIKFCMENITVFFYTKIIQTRKSFPSLIGIKLKIVAKWRMENVLRVLFWFGGINYLKEVKTLKILYIKQYLQECYKHS